MLILAHKPESRAAMTRRLLSLVLPAVALLSMAGCTPQATWPWDDAPAKPQATTSRPEAPAAQRPAAVPAQRPAKAADLKALRPPPRPDDKDEAAAVPPAPTPLKLVGLSEDETAELLGRPAEENVQPPGKIWIYQAGGCRLSVHLFPDMEKGGFYALDYTVADGAREACLGKVAGEARKKGSALTTAAKTTG